MKKTMGSIFVIVASLSLVACKTNTTTVSQNETTTLSVNLSTNKNTLGYVEYYLLDGYSKLDDSASSEILYQKECSDGSTNVISFDMYDIETSFDNSEYTSEAYKQMFFNWNNTDKVNTSLNGVDYEIYKWELKGSTTSGSLSEKSNTNTSYSIAFSVENYFYVFCILFKDENVSIDDFAAMLNKFSFLDYSTYESEAPTVPTDVSEYMTGITYDNIARTPDAYEGSLVSFTGTVIQLIENGDQINLRVAINDDYDQVIYCGYLPSITTERVLENDTITLYGQSKGLVSYESTLGGQITIPAVYITRIDIIK